MASLLQLRPTSSFQEIVKYPRTAVPKLSYSTAAYTLDLPFDKISVFARKYETSGVLKGMPVFAVAELGILNPKIEPPTRDEDLNGHDRSDTEPTSNGPRLRRVVQPWRQNPRDQRPPPKTNVPLGMLSTDHAGYASFDLAVLRTSEVLAALQRQHVLPEAHLDSAQAGIVEREHITIGLVHLWILPFADPVLIVDALLESDIGPDYMTLRLNLDARKLQDRVLSSATMPSMQNPGILDYKMSPGSFSLPSAVLVGDEGCESLMPSNLATQTFRFYQLARAASSTVASNKARFGSAVKGFRLGYIFEYSAEWYQVGHSLGSLTYSLPLAPGEVVKIAVVDWSRTDSANRAEATQFSESLVHDTLRDRTLGETVTAMLDEWQRGGSIMGGVAASGSASGGAYSDGAAGALGGAYTTSSGTRNLSAETSQRVADAFHQSTSAMRELRSTVVVSNAQAETSKVQTRVVANYNHGHALTMLYYEVLRHYRVVTKLARSPRLALLCDYSHRKPDFRNEKFLLSFRREIEELLLDQTLKTSFDAVTAVYQGRAQFKDAADAYKATTKDPGAVIITQLAIKIWTGSDGSGGTNADPYVDLVLMDQSRKQTWQIEPNDTGNPRQLGRPGYDDFEQGDVSTHGLRPQGSSLTWKDLRGFIVGTNDGDDWRIDHLLLTGVTSTGDTLTLFDGDYKMDLPNDTETPEFFVIKPPAPPAGPSIDTFVKAADLQAVDRLVHHLESHAFYYTRFLWLNENVNARSAEFDELTLNNRPILDLIENRAVEISGNWVAFPVLGEGHKKESTQAFLEAEFNWTDQDAANPADAYVEQLLALPTRGVFAEAKLGHCNANEKIDNTRFWDWQKSPIPYQAPEITGADAGTRYQEPKNLSPTNFPQSVVNIVSPQAVPDPQGLGEALKVLGTPDIFRDQSAAKEVGTLLGKLSDNATALATKGIKDNNRQELLKDIRDAPELDQAQKKKLVNDLLTKQVADETKPEAQGGGDNTSPGTTTPGTGPGTTGTTTGTGGGTAPSQTGSQPGDGEKPGTTKPKDDEGTTTPPSKPTPAPGPAKTKQPDPLPKRGLVFQLNFHRPRINTTVTGSATVTIRPSGTGISHDPDTYIPGSTSGPPTVSQQKNWPEVWQEVNITDGTVWLSSDHMTAPGVISINVSYDIRVVDKASLITGVLMERDLSQVERRTSRISWSNSLDYIAPAAGNLVVFNITPEIREVSKTITFENSQESSTEGELGVEEVVAAKLTHSEKDASGKTTAATLSIACLTDGLTITQVGKP